MYDHGDGVQQDYAKALEWFRRAAEQGDRDAQFYLGTLYERGDGVRQDYARAWAWLKAAQGNAGAAALVDHVAARLAPSAMIFTPGCCLKLCALWQGRWFMSRYSLLRCSISDVLLFAILSSHELLLLDSCNNPHSTSSPGCASLRHGSPF
jgi:hypothetical protein